MFHLVNPTHKRRQRQPVAGAPVPLTCSHCILIAPRKIWPPEFGFSRISILQHRLPKGSLSHATSENLLHCLQGIDLYDMFLESPFNS